MTATVTALPSTVPGLAAAALLAASLASAPAARSQTEVPPPRGAASFGLELGAAPPPEAVKYLFRVLADQEEPDWALLAGIAFGMAGREPAPEGASAESSPSASRALPSAPPQGPPPPGPDGFTVLPPPSAGTVIPPVTSGVRDPDPLAEVSDETFWFRLGAADSPSVWMLADPGCPHSARALSELSGEIASGRLHVRLALAPFLGPRSSELAASIILDRDPANAAWRMLLGAAQGTAPAPSPGAAAAAGGAAAELFNANIGWMRRQGVRSVPHFVWLDERGGWMQASGVQPSVRFSAAARPGGPDAMSAPAAVLERIAALYAAPPLPAASVPGTP